MKMPKDQLTARQKQFCQLYAGEARHNAALAARLAPVEGVTPADVSAALQALADAAAA